MKIIDLTTALFVGMPITPASGHPREFLMERTATFEEDGKVVSKLTVGTHTGTRQNYQILHYYSSFFFNSHTNVIRIIE